MYSYRLPIALACAVLAAPAAASSATATPPSLDMAVQNAWQRSPLARTLEARQAESEAARQNARSWVAGAPTLGLSERADRWTDQRDRRESEVSLAAPLWLPGQKAAREALAARGGEELRAQLAQARLAVAGEVRSAIWETAAAQETLALHQDHLDHLQGLTAEVMRRVEAGDLARSDGLLARQELLAAQGDIAVAKTRLQEAQSRYFVLTGLRALPPLEPEPLAAPPGAEHARLRAARVGEERAQAALGVALATRSGPPTVTLSARREQQPGTGLPAVDRSIGIALQVPLGTAARNRPAETFAATQLASASAETARAAATIEADIALARERLAIATEALHAAQERAAAMHEHTVLIGKAFREGERGLAELLRSRALTHEADMAVRQQRVALGLAHALMNQALGVAP